MRDLVGVDVDRDGSRARMGAVAERCRIAVELPNAADVAVAIDAA